MASVVTSSPSSGADAAARCVEATRALEAARGTLYGRLRGGSGVLSSATALWQHVLAGGVEQWYAQGLRYWDAQPPTLDAVLGGYGHVHRADVRDGAALLARARAAHGCGAGLAARAVDCGAGIGRVALDLLRHVARRVDVLEPCAAMCDVAAAAVRTAGVECAAHAIGLQDAHALNAALRDGPQPSIVYICFCIGHLTDADAITALRLARAYLEPQGVIMVKDNVADGASWTYDTLDSSLTRGRAYFEALWDAAQLRVLAEEAQSGEGWDDELGPVHTWVLGPAIRSCGSYSSESPVVL